MSQFLHRAHLLLTQNRPEQALTEIQRHLAQEPQDGLALAFQGEILAELDRKDEALKAVQQAIVQEPDASEVHYAYSRVLLALKKLKPSFEAIQEAIRLDPERPHYYCQQAVLYAQKSAWDKMLEATERALELDPENDQATNLRAMALKRLRRKEDASQALESAMQRNPEDPHTHANQGWLLLEQGNTEQALHHFREALRLDPQLDWARLGIIEAMKSRHFIYRFMLGFFFWMANFSPRTRWMIILGAWAAVNVLGGMQESLGPLGVIVPPLTYIYLAFVLMTWMAVPLFNFMLRFNSYGRLALDRRQTAQANWLAVCLACSLAFLIGYFIWPSEYLLIGALWSAVLTIPVTTCYETVRGKYRIGMAVYSFCLASLLGFLVVYGLLVLQPQLDDLKQLTSDNGIKLHELTDRESVDNATRGWTQVQIKRFNEQMDNYNEKMEKLNEQSMFHLRLFNLMQIGILISCFLPAILPDQEDRNEVDVRFS